MSLSSRKVIIPEILQVAEIVSKEQGISKDSVFSALEIALQRPALVKYGENNDIQVVINRETGEISFYRRLHVVAKPSNTYAEVSIEEGRLIKKDCKIDDYLLEELPAISFDRVDANLTRQIIEEKIKETKRALHFEEYKEKEGELITVVVKRNEITYMLVEFGNKVEGIIGKNDLLPGEKLQIGERIQAVITEVHPEASGPVVRLSRTNNNFLRELLKKEVNEVYEGIIEIKAIARSPGSRSKIAVYSADNSVDAVGACIGVKGSRINSVSNELMGEKIDVIQWSPDPATFVINALAPAEITKVIVDEDKRTIEVVLPEAQLSLAIGKKGQNIKLASALTRWKINMITEEVESKRASEEKARICKYFVDTLNVDEMIGYLLATEGYTAVEQLVFEEIDHLASIEGFDYDLAQNLKNRAEKYYNKQKEQFVSDMRAKGVSEDLIEYDALSIEQKAKLAADDIKSIEDLAYLSGDELKEILEGEGLTIDECNDIVMELREKYLGVKA